MKTDNTSFPHPVLGLSDDVEGNFSLGINIERIKDDKAIQFVVSNIVIDNPYFNSLIERNIAGIVYKVYCSSTFKTWTFKNVKEIFKIPEDEICNKVEIQPLIVALSDIERYTDESFNPEFDDCVFSVKKHEIIGLLGSITIPIDKDYEKLSLGNIFNFSPEEDCKKPCSFEFRTDKITIRYPVTINGDHPPTGLFHKSPWAAYNIFIIPALTEAFRIMSDDDQKGDFESLDWYFVLNSLLPEDQRDNDPYRNAQLLLDNDIPVLKAFDELCVN